MNAQGLSSLDDPGSKAVTAVFEDREGNIWVGRGDELERIRESAFLTSGPEPNTAEQQAGPVHADAQGRIWAGSRSHGLRELRNSGQTESVVFSLGHDEAYSITGSGESLWIGWKSGGLTHLSSRDGLWSGRTYTKADGLPENSVYAVHQSRDGSIWAGTVTGGVSHLANGHFTNYNMTAGLVSNSIISIAEDSDGRMWFATPSGLSCFAQDRWATFSTGQGLPSGIVNTLFADSIWPHLAFDSVGCWIHRPRAVTPYSAAHHRSYRSRGPGWRGAQRLEGYAGATRIPTNRD